MKDFANKLKYNNYFIKFQEILGDKVEKVIVG